MFAVTDLCDAYEDSVSVVEPIFKIYGKKRGFSGQIVTLKIFDDNSLVREMLSEQGKKRVLVVDGGGSQRCALVGGQLGALAEKNSWAGIIVFGCIRDVNEINDADIGVRALNIHPLKSKKKGVGDKNIPVKFGGVRFTPGEFLYADDDGIIVSKISLI